jgi:hypothetical protein
MEEMIAFCGLVCTKCPAYIAKKEDNNELRKETAEKWSKDFNSEIKPEDVNCDGCLTTDGVVIQYCNMCEIRKCGLEKKVQNCAYCNEYICEKLEKWFKNVPTAKEVLDKVKENK